MGRAGDGVCLASVADDTRAPRDRGQTCRKGLGTAGGQVRVRQLSVVL